MPSGSFHGVAILTALREALTAALGDSRAIPSGTYLSGILGADQGAGDAQRAISAPRVEAFISKQAQNKASPPTPGSRRFWDLDVGIRVVRTVSREHALDTTSRDWLRGAAANDAASIADALGYPANLTTTAGGAPTGIVSGVVRYVTGGAGRVELTAELGRLVTTHTLRCVVDDVLWTPASLAPSLWLRADKGVTVTEGTHVVTAWADQSTNGETVTVAGTPDRNERDAVLGLRHSLTLDGSTEYATVTDFEPAAGESFDIVVIAAGAVTTGHLVEKFDGTWPTGNGFMLYMSSGSLVVRTSTGANQVAQAAGGGTLDTRTVYRGSFDTTTGTITAALNGSTNTNTAAGTIGGDFTNPATFTIGADSAGASFYDGEIAEVLVNFGTAWTATQLTRLREYVNARYGTSLTAI